MTRLDLLPPASPDRLDRLDRRIAAVTSILLVTLVVALLPGVSVRVVAPGLDLVLDTVTALVALAVAALAWARHDHRRPSVLLEAAAFIVLAAASASAAVTALGILDASRSPGPAPFSEASLYVGVAARILAAGLLVAAGSSRAGALGRIDPRLIVLLPGALVLVLAATASAWATLAPSLVAAAPDGAGLPVATPANVLLQIVGAGLFAGAAARVRRRARQDGAVSDGYLVIGLVVAAAAQLHLTLFPSAYAGMLTGGDLLFLVFDVILLLGIEAETRVSIVRLRHANAALQRLREDEVEQAAIEERARLSRELHDCLAQDLWLAKLKLGRLVALPDLTPDARMLGAELDDAIDAGLTEARQAFMALRSAGDGGAQFADLVARYADDVADRFSMRIEVRCDAAIPRLGARTEAELLRIAQEALSNVRRHADATVAWVTVELVEHQVVLSVRDNGHGFDPASRGMTGFGLTSMRERAELIGGLLTVTSRPSDGTLVAVRVPVPAQPRLTAVSW